MPISLIFWVLMLLWILSTVGTWGNWNGPWVYGSTFLQLVLFFLLGWKVFGFIIQG